MGDHTNKKTPPASPGGVTAGFAGGKMGDHTSKIAPLASRARLAGAVGAMMLVARGSDQLSPELVERDSYNLPVAVRPSISRFPGVVSQIDASQKPCWK